GAVPSAAEDVGPYGLSWQDGIVLVQLRCGKANALNPRTLAAIDQALDGAERGGARGVVLTGYDRFFSAGLDLVTLYDLAPEALVRGLVHDLTPGDVIPLAHAACRRLSTMPAAPFATIKAALRAPALERARAQADALRRAFVDAWYAPDARRLIGEVRARLGERPRDRA